MNKKYASPNTMMSLKNAIIFYENAIRKGRLGAPATKRLSQLRTRLRSQKMNKSKLYKRIMKRDAIKNGV